MVERNQALKFKDWGLGTKPSGFHISAFARVYGLGHWLFVLEGLTLDIPQP